jgi:hypothetical protein
MLDRQISDPASSWVKRPRERRDFDAIGFDFHAAEQCHERRFDFIWCVGSEFLRDLTATFNQLAPPWVTVRILVDGIEDRSGVGEKCPKPVGHQAFQIAGRYPPAA